MSQAQAIQAALGSGRKTFASLAAGSKVKGSKLKIKSAINAVDPELAEAAQKYEETQEELDKSDDTDEGLAVNHHIFIPRTQHMCLDAHALRQANPPGSRGTHGICCY